jgi:hypothetical protein
MLMQSLLAGESVKKAAARVGVGNDLVPPFLLETGAACRAFHDRTVVNLRVETVRCQRVWGFPYVHRRNAYMPEISRGVPREGWAWVAHHAESGLVVDWAVSSGDASAAEAFITCVRDRLSVSMALKGQGRDLFLERGSPRAQETALLSRLFDLESRVDENGMEGAAMAATHDFRRRCLNLELALSLHFTCHNFLADAGQVPPAVRLGLVSQGRSLEALLDVLTAEYY